MNENKKIGLLHGQDEAEDDKEDEYLNETVQSPMQ